MYDALHEEEAPSVLALPSSQGIYFMIKEEAQMTERAAKLVEWYPHVTMQSSLLQPMVS